MLQLMLCWVCVIVVGCTLIVVLLKNSNRIAPNYHNRLSGYLLPSNLED